MIGSLSKTTNKEYGFNDFDYFISNYGSIKHNLEKRDLNYILGLTFGNNEQVEVGDIIFMWKNKDSYYTHTFIIYNNDGQDSSVFDKYDTVVYASGVCPGPDPMDKGSIRYYSGQLCYSPIGRYLDDPEIRFTLFHINDLE